MHDNGFRIPQLLDLLPGAPAVRVVDLLLGAAPELGNPLLDVLAAGVELLALEDGVEDAKVGLRVDADAGAEAPAAVVGREVAVDQVLHEEALAHAPVEQQVLGQERRHDHAAPVVHPRHGLHLAHGRVHDGEARPPRLPRVKVRRVVRPRDVGVFGLEGLVHAVHR